MPQGKDWLTNKLEKLTQEKEMSLNVNFNYKRNMNFSSVYIVLSADNIR